MAATRIFLMGVVVLFVGVQLRAVDTFVLNETATKIVNSRLNQPATEYNTYSAFAELSPYAADTLAAVAQPPAMRSISPPRWLGWSFCSIGAVLILSCPCFRS